jgi:hypothetical protein
VDCIFPLISGDSSKGSTEGSGLGEFWCLEALQGATMQDPCWEDSRLKMVGLDVLPTYKRVAAWFLDPVENTGRFLQRLRRLNRGLDTDNWRVYEHGGAQWGPPCA